MKKPRKKKYVDITLTDKEFRKLKKGNTVDKPVEDMWYSISRNGDKARLQTKISKLRGEIRYLKGKG